MSVNTQTTQLFCREAHTCDHASNVYLRSSPASEIYHIVMAKLRMDSLIRPGSVAGQREILLAENEKDRLFNLDEDDYRYLSEQFADSCDFDKTVAEFARESLELELEFAERVSRTMLIKDLMITLLSLEAREIEDVIFWKFYTAAFLAIKQMWMKSYRKTGKDFRDICMEILDRI